MFGRSRAARAIACAVTLAITVVAAPAHAGETVVTTNQRGTHDGCFYWFWQDTGGAAMTLRPGGYRAEWNDANNWIGGKGWETGGPRRVSYSGTFEPGRVGYLALFGVTTAPYVEYYIVENWGEYRPGGEFKGTVTTDGGTYDIYREAVYHGLPLAYYRFWSVRQTKRTGGTIHTGNHFAAWAGAGMNLGTHDLMVMATEGYRSSGRSDIRVNCGRSRR